jgi:hypothetical protein
VCGAGGAEPEACRWDNRGVRLCAADSVELCALRGALRFMSFVLWSFDDDVTTHDCRKRKTIMQNRKNGKEK